MLQINSTTRIALAINPVDFRKGIDTLAAYYLKQIGIDRFSGRLFAFRNRKTQNILQSFALACIGLPASHLSADG